MMHWDQALVVALVVISAGLLLATAIAWRRLISEGSRLPLWRFLRRNGVARDDAADALGRKAVMQADLSCTLCGSSRQCLERLAAGAAVPFADCPNAHVFGELGLRLQTGAVKNATRSQEPKAALDFTSVSRSKGPKPAA